jgi:hypothetical protein
VAHGRPCELRDEPIFTVDGSCNPYLAATATRELERYLQLF